MSKIKKIIIVFLTVFIFVFASSFNIFALSGSTVVVDFPMSQPQVTEKTAYCEVLWDNGTVNIFIINTSYTTSTNYNADTASNIIWEFYADGNTYGFKLSSGSLISTNTAKVTAYYITGNGAYYPMTGSGLFVAIKPDSTHTNKVYYNGTQKIANIHAYGCNISSSVSWSGVPRFIVNYGTDALAIQKLEDIYNAINSQSGFADKITSNADKNASAIQDNNDKNTQSIIDNQNQLAEQEKTETQNSANSSVDDVSGSVPDKSAGMLSALQSLSNAVSYTGTTAKWTFPQMYIPAIAGVTDKINLNSEMEIDFAYWINQIPQDVRTVISAIATIGLVIFAFKELYGLISYVLTLKGGGNNE